MKTRNFKRVLAMLLSLCLIVTMMPVQAFAAISANTDESQIIVEQSESTAADDLEAQAEEQTEDVQAEEQTEDVQAEVQTEEEQTAPESEDLAAKEESATEEPVTEESEEETDLIVEDTEAVVQSETEEQIEAVVEGEQLLNGIETEDETQAASDTTTCTITFYEDESMETVLETLTVEKGEVPKWTEPEKESDDFYRYVFAGWNTEVVAAIADCYYYATWTRIEQFDVTFVDWDDTVIKEIRVDKGTNLAESTEVPANPTREADKVNTYEFSGWSPELSTAVSEDATYKAQYKATEIITYVDLTFRTADNGIYTVNGAAITEETEFSQTMTKTEYTLKAVPAEGYEFFGWYDGVTYISADAEYTFKPAEDMTIRPVFVEIGTPKFSVDGTVIEADGVTQSFSRAITAAKRSESKVMVLMNDVTLPAGEYEIPEGITLLIPCDEEGTVYYEEPVVYKDEVWEKEPTAFRTLTLAEGAKLTVDGVISIASPHVPGAGGKENGSSPYKTYGHIVTENGSNITINEGGFLYAYGYITGDGTVTAKSGATVYEYFQVMDFRGGSATTDMAQTGIGFGVFPLSQYYVQNIEIPLTLEAGATEYCYTSLKMSGNVVSAPVGFIGLGDDMMFKLHSGSVTKYYDGERDRMVAEINGDLDISPIVISGGNNTIDSDNFVLPINSNITIKINSGNINMTQDVALTPGTELLIEEGATCSLGKNCNVYVYDADTWGDYCGSDLSKEQPFVDLNYAPGRTYIRTEADLTDALVKVAGTFDASKGYLYTTEGGANIYSEGEGTIILRKGAEKVTYQFEYTGPPAADEKYYGIYHEIPITAALLKNADGSFVNQNDLAANNIVKYTYADGVWNAIGHAYNEYEAEEANCVIDGRTYGTDCAYGEACAEHYNPSVIIPALGHDFSVEVEAKEPTYTSEGWNAHHECSRCGAKDETYKEIEMLPSATIENYDEFIKNLALLEEWAAEYIKENPGKDPANLVIKFIRTGVERYNSGSWGIMAGYEDQGFARFVAAKEDAVNSKAAEEGKELVKVSGLKNIYKFTLPNNSEVEYDMGHVFGTMDITYHNNFGVNHADVAGWTGDIVDLLSVTDQLGTGDAETVNEMTEYVTENYFLKETEEIQDEFDVKLNEGSYSLADLYGDLDGYYIMKELEKIEYETGTLTELLTSYFTEDLTDYERADYLIVNRLDDVTLRGDLRNAVYEAYTGNSVIATLEGTRDWTNEDPSDLHRRAACYAFADYICKLAGDYVDSVENEYMTTYDEETMTLAPGITQKKYKATSADEKNMAYYTATIDVTRSDVHVYANYKDNGVGLPNQEWGMQRVLEQSLAAQARYSDPESPVYTENFNIVAAINAGGYDMSDGYPGGLLVMEGIEWTPKNGTGFFGILQDGTAIIGTDAEYEALKAEGKVKEAIGGFGTTLIKDGEVKITATSDYYTSRASRTAVGITKTGKVVFMVLDGRQGGDSIDSSCGGSMEEIAQIMLDAGCEHAINLDGGGSSTYVAKEAGTTELAVVNKPSDGAPRSISTSLFAASTAPSSTAFDHAVVDVDTAYLTAGASVQLTATGVSATNNVVELPEGTTWKVEDESIGTITEDGVFTGKANGDVIVSVMLDEAVVGEITLHVVTPDNLYFTRDSLNAVYGQTVVLPVKAVYNNKEVAITAADIAFSLSDASAGKIDGFNFAISETSNLKLVHVTAKLPGNDNVSKNFTIYLYDQGAASFDFEQATGGNRQFAWDRQVSNAILGDDKVTYSAMNVEEPMTTSYTFAIDMSQIEIPEVLEDLTYMLPGSDMADASAWTFLCNLAERMSDQTEVRPVIYFDEDVTVDYSEMTLVNDYFTLNKDEMVFDEEENKLTLTLRWKKQSKPIEIAMANPICIMSGIKITPKEDATWNNKEQLEIVNKGEIGYTIYMRASGLYSFSQKAENQEKYGLLPYVHPKIETEKGGYFESVYSQFEDSYTLDKSIKNGWVMGNGGFGYFVNGEAYTGIHEIDGLYYDFGKTGINKGKTPYTGEMTDEEGNEYYVEKGKIWYGGWIQLLDGVVRYYNEETGIREEITADETPSTCIIDGHCIYTSASGETYKLKYDDAGGHEYEQSLTGAMICSVCGWEQVAMEDLEVKMTTAFTYTGNEIKPIVNFTNPITKAELKKYNPYKDFRLYEAKENNYYAYANNVEVGTASVTYRAEKYGMYVNMQQWRGNYSGIVTLNYTIHPDAPTNVQGTYADDTVNLTWEAAKVASAYENTTDYVVYQSVNGGEWTVVGETAETAYTVTGLNHADAYKFKVATRTIGTDGNPYECRFPTNAKLTVSAPKVKSAILPATGKIQLSWNAVSGAEKYQVYYATEKNGTYNRLTTTTDTAFTHAKAVPGKTYYYKVRVYNNDRGGIYSDFSNVVNKICDLAKVTGLKASNVEKTGKIKLTWNKVAGAEKYKIFRAASKNGPYSVMKTVTTNTYTNASAVAGKTYYYKVQAIDNVAAANGVKSDSVSRVCDLAKVTGLKASNVEKTGKIKLTWNKVAGAEQYRVFRATSKNGQYVAMKTVKAANYINVSAAPGKTYYYKVQALDTNKNANGAKSGYISRVCDLAKVTGLKASNVTKTGKIKLTWNKVAGAEKYAVYRSVKKAGTYTKVGTVKTTSFINTKNAVPGKTYYYKVQALDKNQNANGAKSVIVSKTVKLAQPKVTAKSPAKKQVKLSWKKVTGAKKYEIWRAAAKNGKYTKVATVEKLNYTNKGLKSGKTYYYKVKAIVKKDTTAKNSAFSAIKQIKVK